MPAMSVLQGLTSKNSEIDIQFRTFSYQAIGVLHFRGSALGSMSYHRSFAGSIKALIARDSDRPEAKIGGTLMG